MYQVSNRQTKVNWTFQLLACSLVSNATFGHVAFVILSNPTIAICILPTPYLSISICKALQDLLVWHLKSGASPRILLSSAFDLSQKFTEKITFRHRPKGQSLITKPQPSDRKHSLSARSKTAMSFCAPCVCPENQSTTCHLDCQWRSIKLDVLCRARTLRVSPMP